MEWWSGGWAELEGEFMDREAWAEKFDQWLVKVRTAREE